MIILLQKWRTLLQPQEEDSNQVSAVVVVTAVDPNVVDVVSPNRFI